MTIAKASRLPQDWIDRLKMPVMAAPMFLVSSTAMVLEGSRNGIIGCIPTVNARTPEILDGWLAELTSGLEQARSEGVEVAPWALGLTTHRTNARLPDDLELCRKYRPPLVITALGSPKPAIEAVHSYGGLVFADVSTPEYARKAAEAGADGLVLVCSGAGGHTGQIAAAAFVQAVREFFDGIIVIGGAISTGSAVRSAQILGADLVYVGTHLIACEESNADPRYKQMVVDATSKDLVMTNVITGAWSHKLRPSLEAVGLDPDNLGTATGFDLNYAEKQPKAWKDIWSAGQGVGAVKKIEPMAAVVAKLHREYQQAIREEQNDPWFRKYSGEAACA
ncbi:nitronate monooxygenase [Mesorhizobium sp. LHD-90]|uniref:NAD(P)H-dependent flavin oxidoreductase n=1 Tax=Mesorhizobium sp. LHD-90 TaxID=3071414 RepID=UPI0027DF7C7D|nr:nitronate monooxygenase [Mesorhizobium sp. LHD-90]MDQ6432537.1 nitronate monooxygenase [Mesorhizobium sp. LHD-90]